MSSIVNAISGAAVAAKEAVVGKDEAAEQAQKSGQEPTAGAKGDAKVEPYDKGNLETPLGSPITPGGPLGATSDLASTAAHTDPAPTAPTTHANPNSDEPAPAAAVAAAAANVKNDANTTNADTSGPSVGNATVVQDAGKEIEPKKEEAKLEGEVAGIKSPAEAEKEIKAEAKEADPSVGESKTEKGKGKAEEVKEKAEEKVTVAKETATPSTPKAKKETSAESDSTASGKKKLSKRIKEKLHIGKKDKPSS